MRPRRGTAIKPDASAELLLPRSPASRHRQGAPSPGAGRFSPLNAPQRAIVEGFLAEARPWAMRQARRSYRHLPVELHEQALDQASLTMRTGAPAELDRRTLYAELAGHLDEELRRIHVGWCLNQARVEAPSPTSPASPVDAPAAAPLTAFLEEGLGGLERAVLQLEIGAGRDTHTVRAALRLGPRQYGRHRELGLAKLRGAITGGLRGRVCDQHLDAVTLAATGDRSAADSLASGPGRCRACAREAAGLKRVLQQRLALAPWPFLIKPAGALAAKLGAVGALLGGKSAVGGGMAATTGGGAKMVAALVATAAVASGGIAAVESDEEKVRRAASAPAATKAVTQATTTRSSAASPSTTASGDSSASARERRASDRRRRAARDASPAKAPAPVATADAPASSAGADAPAPGAGKPLEPVRETVDSVRKTVDRVKQKLPVQAPPVVDDVTAGLDRTVDDVTGAVDQLLAP